MSYNYKLAILSTGLTCDFDGRVKSGLTRKLCLICLLKTNEDIAIDILDRLFVAIDARNMFTRWVMTQRPAIMLIA